MHTLLSAEAGYHPLAETQFQAPMAIGLPRDHVCRGVCQLVWEILSLVGGQLAGMRDGRRLACRVDHTAMYVCHVALRMPIAAIAVAMNRDRRTVSRACHLTEDRRDDPRFDRFVSCLERMAVTAFGQAEGAVHG